MRYKRFVAACLSLVLTFSLFPAFGMAADESEGEVRTFNEVIEFFSTDKMASEEEATAEPEEEANAEPDEQDAAANNWNERLAQAEERLAYAGIPQREYYGEVPHSVEFSRYAWLFENTIATNGQEDISIEYGKIVQLASRFKREFGLGDNKAYWIAEEVAALVVDRNGDLTGKGNFARGTTPFTNQFKDAILFEVETSPKYGGGFTVAYSLGENAKLAYVRDSAYLDWWDDYETVQYRMVTFGGSEPLDFIHTTSYFGTTSWETAECRLADPLCAGSPYIIMANPVTSEIQFSRCTEDEGIWKTLRLDKITVEPLPDEVLDVFAQPAMDMRVTSMSQLARITRYSASLPDIGLMPNMAKLDTDLWYLVRYATGSVSTNVQDVHAYTVEAEDDSAEAEDDSVEAEDDSVEAEDDSVEAEDDSVINIVDIITVSGSKIRVSYDSEDYWQTSVLYGNEEIIVGVGTVKKLPIEAVDEDAADEDAAEEQDAADEDAAEEQDATEEVILEFEESTRSIFVGNWIITLQSTENIVICRNVNDRDKIFIYDQNGNKYNVEGERLPSDYNSALAFLNSRLDGAKAA